MEWRQFVMNLESLDPDRLEAALVGLGALSVTFTDAGDNPVLEPAPGETPLWAETRVTALFAAGTGLENLGHSLAAALQVAELPAHRVEVLADRDWEREWLRDFHPLRFGRRLWIVPGQMQAPRGDAVVVRLDPGLAFGTGTHPTTALCLRWLDGISLAGKTVFDFGCGSGILGIAALKLGAATVQAVDIDLQAVLATRQNALRNHVDDRIQVGSEATAAQPFDVVVANILAATLIDNARQLCATVRPGGNIALSGILTSQVDAVLDAYRDDIDFVAPAVLDEWVLLSGTRI